MPFFKLRHLESLHTPKDAEGFTDTDAKLPIDGFSRLPKNASDDWQALLEGLSLHVIMARSARLFVS